jgi:hypothetical protein
LPDVRDFAELVPKIPQFRLALFNEALRGYCVFRGSEAAETPKRLSGESGVV